MSCLYNGFMKKEVLKSLLKAAQSVGIEGATIKLDYPENPEHGDFSSNIAMVHAKKMGVAPKALAEKIVAEVQKDLPDTISSVSVAGPGFINLKIRDKVFAEEIVSIVTSGAEYGWTVSAEVSATKGREVLIEYTDPNTFKVFHIGHLMSNAIGESLSRLIETDGTQVVRLCYPSDIGLHIAKSLWAMEKHSAEIPADSAPIQEKTTFLGKMYVEGTVAYEKDPAAKDDIDALNKVIYAKSSPAVNAMYEKGRQWSLDHFELLYKRLGTKFNEYIFESEMAPVGLEVVKEFLKKGVFAESEGAIVFKGEDYGLHTRVFINSHGLPTYEAKEIGLNTTKFKKYPDADKSIIVTASEQNAYFQVLKKALTLIDEQVGSKTEHIGHGMLRFASGKMSSRTGKVITAEALIADIKELVSQKITDRGFSAEDAEEISDTIAIGAIKYTILRQATGGDVIFDSASSISFEGDSGPYLQYSVVRASSVLEKAKQEGIAEAGSKKQEARLPGQVTQLERMITRFPDILEHARKEYAPQHVANYLIALAGEFNSYYAGHLIADKNEPLAPYRVALTKAFVTTMTNGLWVLGISVPKKM
jgi:arginyl-tRNA synthetase